MFSDPFKNMDCHGFPGPGSDASSSIYTFNPMREFVEGHTDHVDASFNEFVRSVLIWSSFRINNREPPDHYRPINI